MGVFASWLSVNYRITPISVDPQRTIVIANMEPSAERLGFHFGVPPQIIVLPGEPEWPLPGVTYYRFRPNTNPIEWEDAVETAIRAGCDTVVFFTATRQVRGKMLLRLHRLGVRRVLLPDQDQLRAYSPRLLALWRTISTLATTTLRYLRGLDKDIHEEECDAVMAFAPSPAPAPPADHRLRVAYYINSLNSGGAERQVCNSAIAQQREGHDVRILTKRALLGEHGHYHFLLNPQGIPVRRIGSYWHEDFPEAWARRGLSMEVLDLLPTELSQLIMDLLGELLTDPVDVIHCFGDDCNIVGFIAATLAGVPAIIMSFRNGNPTYFPDLFRPWMRGWYRGASGRAGVMLSANSEFGAQDYASWLDLPHQSVPVLRNAFEVPPVSDPVDAMRWRQELGLPRNAPVVAGIFRLQREKRPLFFIECMDRLRQQIPDLRVVLAGIGELEPAVRAEIAERGLQSVIQLLGQRRDIPTILAGSDVLLLTSDMEGTPNVLLEAQHCGCVPVATAARGSREAVLDGETGLVVELDDVDGVVAAVAGLLADPVRRLRMAAAGPAFVAERFSQAALLEGNLRLYRTALAAAKVSRLPARTWDESASDGTTEPTREGDVSLKEFEKKPCNTSV